MTPQRLAYDDPDTAHEMARDAVACSTQWHLVRTWEKTPAEQQRPDAPRHDFPGAVAVSPATAGFAGRLFD